MKAMILAAGRGTRLAPLTDTTPKPLLPIQGQPLIHWQLKALAKAGISECVINLFHLGHAIEEFLQDGARYNIAIEYSREAELLETGGGIVNALSHFNDEPFLIVNGDIWTDFDFANLIPRPEDCLDAHLVMTPTPKWRASGDFLFQPHNSDTQTGLVPGRGTDFVYCGISILTPDIFAGYYAHPFSLRDIFFELIAKQRLSAQIHHGVWHDIGTLDQYHALNP